MTTWLKQRNTKILNARAILCRGGKPTFNPETVEKELEMYVPPEKNDKIKVRLGGQNMLPRLLDPVSLS